MSNDFSAINYLISSVLLVTDCTFNKAQFSDFLVAMVCAVLDSHFFCFICRAISIKRSMINVCANAPSHTADAFLFCCTTVSGVPAHFPQVGGLLAVFSVHLFAM